MKPLNKFATTIGLLMAVLSSSQALAQIAWVKTIGTLVYNTEGAQMMIWAPAGGVAAGNSIIISLALNPGSTLLSCFDIKGNTYSVDHNVVQGSGTSGVRTIVVSAHNVIPLVQYDVIVCQHTPSAVRAMSVNEFSGLAATATVDKAAATTGNSNPPTSGSTSTTTQGKELLFGAIGVEAGVNESFTAGAGYTTIGRAGTTKSIATDNVTINPEFRIVNSVGTKLQPARLALHANGPRLSSRIKQRCGLQLHL